MNLMRIITLITALLIGLYRTLYCWIFFIWSWLMIFAIYANILKMVRAHTVERGDIFSNTISLIYAIILGIAWWMIINGKPALKHWALAANLILIFTFIPALVFGNWRGVVKAEIDWWPVILIGIAGILIFSTPYDGWRHLWKSPEK
jgi:hypothetical protein